MIKLVYFFSDFAQLNVFQSTQDCVMKYTVCNVSCNDILHCDCSVLNSLGGIIDQLGICYHMATNTVQNLYQTLQARPFC